MKPVEPMSTASFKLCCQALAQVGVLCCWRGGCLWLAYRGPWLNLEEKQIEPSPSQHALHSLLPFSKFLPDFISVTYFLPHHFAQVCIPFILFLGTSCLWMNNRFVLMRFSHLFFNYAVLFFSFFSFFHLGDNSTCSVLMVRRAPKFSFSKLLMLGPDCNGSLGNITSYHFSRYLHNILRRTLSSQ